MSALSRAKAPIVIRGYLEDLIATLSRAFLVRNADNFVEVDRCENSFDDRRNMDHALCGLTIGLELHYSFGRRANVDVGRAPSQPIVKCSIWPFGRTVLGVEGV